MKARSTASRPMRRRALATLLACALPLLVVSCFLRFSIGSTIVVTSIADEVDVKIDVIAQGVSTTICADLEAFPDVPVDCTYAILTEDGSVEIVSTFQLLGDFGLLGLLIDPVIAQLPASASVNHARVDDGSVVRDLVVTETPRFEAEPGVEITAEAGHKFLIFEFPPEIIATLPVAHPSMGPSFDFDVSIGWRQATAPVGAIPIKILFAGRIEAGGEVFYPPLFPCVDDIADVPAFDFFPGGPRNIIFDVLFHYFDNDDLTCQGRTFDYSQAGRDRLLCDVDGDDDVDRLDVEAIVAARNTPASGPDDPRDRNADGTINVLDARRCTLECTRADCAEQDPACGLGFELALAVLPLAVWRRRRALRAARG